MKNLTLVLLLATLSGAALEAHAQLPAHCNSSQVHSAPRPLNSKQPSRGNFNYRFHMNDPEDKSGPLVIFIPGGPGQASFQTPVSYPDHFRVVRTDPRGLGCNAHPSLQDDDLTSEETARDIVEIIRQLRPQSYILHGLSYGTLVATLVGAMTAEEKLPTPTAVVLEGVIGRAFRPGEYDRDYIKRWDELRRELPASIINKLNDANPLQVDGKYWAAFITSLLPYGRFADGSSVLVGQLSELAGGDEHSPSESARALARRVHELMKEAPADQRKLHRLVTCQEIAPDMRSLQYDFELKDGHLVKNQNRLCEGLSLTRPFDSKRWLIPSPVFYFSGEADPATPPAHARYHFANQRSPRWLVTVKRGGHLALSGALMDCQKEIWAQIATGDGSKLADIVKTCEMPTRILTRAQESTRARPSN